MKPCSDVEEIAREVVAEMGSDVKLVTVQEVRETLKCRIIVSIAGNQGELIVLQSLDGREAIKADVRRQLQSLIPSS